MNVEFIVNDYLLAWNLLFRPSISEDIQKLKERLWKNYPKQYIKMERENVEILKYTNDFIPDDDTLYNFIFNTDEYKIVKKQTDKYRRFLMRIWDVNQKEIQNCLKELLRFNVSNDYKLLIVHPFLDNVEYLKKNPKKNIVWGKREDTEDGLKAIIRILFTIIKYEIGEYRAENKDIVSSIIDLMITNEVYTRITGYTKYSVGIQKLNELKMNIYPYWLMYMGADREDLVSYMMRDRITFDIDDYPINKKLRRMDLYGFIDFCCDNQNQITVVKKVEA